MTIFEANGCSFIAKDDMIVSWLLHDPSREFEPQTTAWMKRVMGSGKGCFVDVGASTGWFSIMMAKLGYDVEAFEPNPMAVDRLAENAELNSVGLTVTKAAVSSSSGSATLYHNAGLPLTSGASLNLADCLAPTGRMNVQTVRLDDELVYARPPRLIKVDVEGHEVDVLEGARGVIGLFRPHLVLEANSDAKRHELVNWIRDHRYTHEVADERNLLCSPE